VEQGVRIPHGRGFAGRVAAERRPIILPDLSKADVWNPILRQKGIQSMLGVPLVANDRATGVLHVGTLTLRDFTDDDVSLLTLVADRVALAIERARLHEELLELDQLKLNFVAIASHELRTPATSVLGVLATLHERGADLTPELRDELVAMGYEQAERLRRLLEQLLDLSRLDARSIEVSPRPIVLRSVIEDVVAGAAGVAVEVPPDLAVVADPLVLERVLSNLEVNAERYGAPPVEITADERDRHLYLRVEDSGPGVPPEIRTRLFDRFERGQDAQGTGLGLAIARAYARAHGGDLVYAPGEKGARFELILPRS
jgi:signal transduction histidine kinase